MAACCRLSLPWLTPWCHRMLMRSSRPPVPLGMMRKSLAPASFCSVVKEQWSVAVHCAMPAVSAFQSVSWCFLLRKGGDITWCAASRLGGRARPQSEGRVRLQRGCPVGSTGEMEGGWRVGRGERKM